MDTKEIALNKLRSELDKDIDLAIDMAKSCGLFEFLYFIYHLHILRLLPFFPLAKSKKKEIVNAYSTTIEESVKYIISLIAKYGNGQIAISKKDKTANLNTKLIEIFIKHGNYINSKYESESLIQLFDVQVSGERNQFVKIDMSKVDSDTDIKNFFNYFLRIDHDTTIKKSDLKNKKALFQDFKDEYNPFLDLFEREFGISVDEFLWLNDQLLKSVSDCLNLKQSKVKKLPNGNIDVTSLNSFFQFSRCFVQDKQKLFESFDTKFHNVLKRLIFKTSEFDAKQLRFHKVTRQPLFEHKQMIIISPELVLDSLITNTHYSLIESSALKQEYIKKQASSFLDKIAAVGKKFDFIEIDREKELFEGKNQIGDIDIILKNKEGRILLIEAKNHVLPMDIYFKDVLKTKEHLGTLQEEWEKKVKKRIDHLKSNYNKYSFPQDYSYIVVSRFPEIISHYSNILILSIYEFEIWLDKFPFVKSYDDFYDKYYESKEPRFTMKDIEEMQKANLVYGRFAKE